jgi:hypothetical protein
MQHFENKHGGKIWDVFFVFDTAKKLKARKSRVSIAE